MSTERLERRYRRLLRAFPPGWRSHREEEVLSVLLDAAAHEGRTSPGAAERWDLLRHGLLARVDEQSSPGSRQRTATLAALSGAALALVSLVLGELAPWVGPALWGHGVDDPGHPTRPGSGAVLYAGWLVALVLMASWRARAARWLLGGVSVGALGAPWWSSLAGTTAPPLYFCVVVAAFAALATCADVTPRFGRATRDAVSCAAVVATVATVLGVLARPHLLWTSGEPGYAYYRQWPFGLTAIGRSLLWAAVPLAVVLVCLAWRRANLRPWLAPAAVVAVPWAELGLLAGTGSTARSGLVPAAGLAVGAALAAMGLLAGVRVTVRRAGPTPASPTSPAS